MILDTSLTHNREVIIAVKKAQSFSTSKAIFIVFLTKKKQDAKISCHFDLFFILRSNKDEQSLFFFKSL